MSHAAATYGMKSADFERDFLGGRWYRSLPEISKTSSALKMPYFKGYTASDSVINPLSKIMDITIDGGN